MTLNVRKTSIADNKRLKPEEVEPLPGETLEEARRRAGFTQKQMAEQLGCSRPTYAAIEQTPGRATVLQAKAICQLLAKNYEQIFFGIDASETNS